MNIFYMVFESHFHISAVFSTCVVARFKVPFLRVVPVILVDDAVLFITLNYCFLHDFYQGTGGWNDINKPVVKLALRDFC